MRIVGGRHRGRALLAPAGLAVRPTADRTREALFNILTQGRLAAEGNPLEGAHVLDAFAGTGALGLEALSRGAGHVTFLESHAPSLAVIEENLANLGESEGASVRRADVTRPPRPDAAQGPAAIVLIDAPYNQGLSEPAIAALLEAGWLAPGALLSVELMKTEPFTPPEGFEVLDERNYGKARLVILRAP